MEKKLGQGAKKIQHQHPLAAVEVWAMDEHRLGLKPIIKRVWTRYGEQPIAKVNWRYQWLWLYGFMYPSTGETYFWILPKVNIELFNKVLADFAKEFGVGKDKHIILTKDLRRLAYQQTSSGSRRSTLGIYALPFSRAATSRAPVAFDK